MVQRAIKYLVVLYASVLFGLGCGKEDVESITGDDTGEVPGNFVARLAPSFRDGLSKVKAALTEYIPGTDFTNRFTGDDSVFGLADESKLSDIYNIKIPDTGIDFLNTEIFSSLKDLGSGDSSFFQAIDTDKYIANPTIYDPTAVDDPSLAKQYYLTMISWEKALSSLSSEQIDAAAPVVVAVLDTGVWGEHEDLESVMWKDPQSGKARGYDAINEKEVSELKDANGHGTHVAGIIAGTGNNKKGIHGVGYLERTDGSTVAEIMPVRVLNDQGAGTSAAMAEGVRWSVQNHLAQQKESGRSKQRLIINMSLGGPFDIDGYDYEKNKKGEPVLRDDIFEYAAGKGALIVVAAGNETCGISKSCKIYGKTFNKAYYFPCSYENVLCVAASTNDDEMAGFSNRLASVGIVAPGWQIISTVPQSVAKSTYAYFNGTSQATPVTAGAAAILWSIYPGFSADEIKQIMQKSAAKVAAITDEVDSGFGRLDLKKALDYAAALVAADKSPSELAADPDSKGLHADLPKGTSGDAAAESDKINGDQSTKNSCGVVHGAAPRAGAFLFLGLFLLPFIGGLQRLLVEALRINAKN